MSKYLSRADVCANYGLADNELVDFADSPGGFTFVTADGVGYIDVPADNPDGADKTGLMLLQPPDGYRGDFPVYTNPEDDDAVVPVVLEAMDKEQLAAHATALGVDVKGNWGAPKLREAIAAHVEGTS